MKKCMMILLALVLSFALVACSNADDSSNGGDVNSPGSNDSNDTSPQTTSPDPVTAEFSIGDTLIFQENYEIKMLSMEFATRVDPPNPGNYYSYYEVKDSGKIYIHSVFEVKNLKGNRLSANDVLSVNVLYDGKYIYDSFAVVEESGGSDFTYTNITGISPLTVGVLHFMTEVPIEVQDSGASVELSITASNISLTCLGETDAPEALVINKQDEITNSNTAWQKYTSLQSEETLVEEDYAEMTLKEAEFSDIVEPANPGKFYSYYEVKDPSSTYAHLVLEFKNLKITGADADTLAGVEVIYDNKYAYKGFSAIEEGGGSDFTYTNITRIDPLDKGTIHYIIEVPSEVRDSGKPVVFTVAFHKANYSYVLVE